MADWDKALAEADRQRLAFARLHVLRPDIVLVDDALYALSAAGRGGALRRPAPRHADAIILAAGRSPVYAAAADLVLVHADGGLASISATRAPARHPAPRPPFDG